ncbi:hypothetical protein L798_15211 [Zootermopsis nevadensis]|uniref:Ionotropic glutamate receptor C-terminal domain-containing protein n=1 Tax=Zootermopsis nevadensis TaxID=136037 RepID=A0A067RTI4_ZOONE|nr:hypothetical protein L798_15211 [Zootermopsis nevadensis]
MSLVRLFLIASGLVQVARLISSDELHWVRCLVTIARRHLASGRTLAISLPTAERESRMADTGERLLGYLQHSHHWSLIVFRDSSDATVSTASMGNHCINYVVLVSSSCNSRELRLKLDRRFSSLDFRHKLMPSWSARTRFVIAVENNCNGTNPRKLSEQIISILWIYKVTNVLIVMQEEYYRNASTSAGRLRHQKLGLYTWFPYESPNRCTQVENAVLLGNWVMDGKGYLVQNSNLFPRKIGKRFNGCPLTVVARNFHNMVEYKKPATNYSGSYTPVIERGWEISLLTIVANSLNMTARYLPAPNSFESQNKLLDVVQALVFGEADIVLGGVESRARWGWEEYVDTTISYLSRRMLWYVPCAFKHPRWSSIFRIFSPQLWLCLVTTLAVISTTVTLVSRCGGARSKPRAYWTVTDSLTCAWAVILGVTAPALPRRDAVRVVFVAWLLFSLAVNAIFQSVLTTFLTESGYKSPVEDMDQMLASEIKYGYHPVLDDVYRQSGDAHASTILRNRMSCPVHAICLKWAFTFKNISLILDELSTDEQYASSRLMDENSKPLLCPIDDGVVMHGNHVMMMHVGHPLLDRINDIIQRVVEAGIFMQWKNAKLRAGALGIYSPLNNYYSFTMNHMQPAFYLLLMGISTSAFIFILELIASRLGSGRRCIFNRN